MRSSLSVTRRLALAGVIVGLLLGVLTWTTLRAAQATRALADQTLEREDAIAAARQADVVLRLTWIAAILLAGGGFFFFRQEILARGASGEAARLRKKHEDELRALSLMDDLTGLNNRRGFLNLAQQQIKLARRNKRELVLLFVDMDDFKQIN
ncbi:MAG: GGDEF domain-containing protein, partial [Gemmatimonadaceae bacterium]